jgi:DNA-binding response OmpR family regulator
MADPQHAFEMNELVILGLQQYPPRNDYVHGLEQSGFEVLLASNEDEFLGFIRNFTPALAVIDLELDDLGAFVIMRVLRSHPTRGNIPIIATGSHWLDESIAIDAGADQFLPKPFDSGELAITVGEQLSEIEIVKAA